VARRASAGGAVPLVAFGFRGVDSITSTFVSAISLTSCPGGEHLRLLLASSSVETRVWKGSKGQRAYWGFEDDMSINGLVWSSLLVQPRCA
jgi:hypothetical protein